MLARQLRWMETSARRTTAGAFRLYRDFLGHDQAVSGQDDAARRKRFAVRELIMLQKIAATWDCTDVVRMAMSVFGGHGVMEDFSCLPRLLRDSAINELWEGPRNVLLTQIHRDFQRSGSFYPPRAFVRDLLAGADDGLVQRFGAELEELLAQPDLFSMDEKTLEVCGRWDSFCQELTHAYQDCALAEVESA